MRRLLAFAHADLYWNRYIPRACFRSLQWLNKSKAEQPWLAGTLAPVSAEIFKRELSVVEGSVPADLTGVYIRTGPNPLHKPHGGYHWYDSQTTQKTRNATMVVNEVFGVVLKRFHIHCAQV